MASLRDVFVRLGIKTDKAGAKQANDSVQRLIKGAKVAVAAFAGLKAFSYAKGIVTETAAIGDSIDKVSSKLGINAQALQELRFAADQSGVAQSNLDMGLQRFTRRAAEAAMGTGEAKDALAELGVRLKDSRGNLRPVDQLLGDVANGLAATGSDADRVRLAFKLFDSEGVSMVNMLRDGRGGLDALRKKARETGGVMDADLIRKSVEYTDTMSELQLTFQGVRNAIAKRLMPAATKMAAGFIRFIKINRDLIKAKLDAFFERTGRLINAVVTFIDDVVDTTKEWVAGFDAVGQHILKITAIVVGLVAVMMLPGMPILLLIALIALLIEDFQVWRAGGESVIGDLVSFFQWLGDEIAQWASGVLDTITGTWQAIKDSVSAAIDAMKAAFESYIDAITDSIQAILDWVDEHRTGIRVVTSIAMGAAAVYAMHWIKAHMRAIRFFWQWHRAGLTIFRQQAMAAIASARKAWPAWIQGKRRSLRFMMAWHRAGLTIWLQQTRAAIVASTKAAAAWLRNTARMAAASMWAGLKSAAAWLMATAPLLLTAALLTIIVGTVIWLGRELIRLVKGEDNFFTTMADGIKGLIDDFGGIGPAIWEMLKEAVKYWSKFFGASDEQITEWTANLEKTLLELWDNVFDAWRKKWKGWSSWIDFGWGEESEEETDRRARALFEASEARRRLRQRGATPTGTAPVPGPGGVARVTNANRSSAVAVNDNRQTTVNMSVTTQPGQDEQRVADMVVDQLRRTTEGEYRTAAQSFAVGVP